MEIRIDLGRGCILFINVLRQQNKISCMYMYTYMYMYMYICICVLDTFL